jgi:hypothetical protein
MMAGPPLVSGRSNAPPPRSSWRRPAVITAGLAIAAVAVAVWPKASPVMTLPSGHHISHVVIGHFMVPNESPVLRFRYETQLPLADTAALRAEAREIWPEFRSYVLRGEYVNAAFLAQAPPSGLCYRHAGFCSYRGYGFLAKRASDGRFYFSGDSVALP